MLWCLLFYQINLQETFKSRKSKNVHALLTEIFRQDKNIPLAVIAF